MLFWAFFLIITLVTTKWLVSHSSPTSIFRDVQHAWCKFNSRTKTTPVILLCLSTSWCWHFEYLFHHLLFLLSYDPSISLMWWTATIISGLMLKTGAVGLILNGKSCKEAGLLHCLKNLTVEYVLSFFFSYIYSFLRFFLLLINGCSCSIMETMGDLDKLEYLAQNTPPIQKWVLILFGTNTFFLLYLLLF